MTSIIHVVVLALTTTFAFVSSSAWATSLNVRVTDAAGNPLADTIVFAESGSGQVQTTVNRVTEIEQKARQFSPLVSVVQTGGEVSFPNNDSVRHHVYSFSPAKIFDIKLYSGVPSSPIKFDKPGPVVIGCNIHDQMLAYIYVVSTPYFAKTDAKGEAKITGLASGNYKLKAWHYKSVPGAPLTERPATVAAADLNVTLKLDLPSSATNN